MTKAKTCANPPAPSPDEELGTCDICGAIHPITDLVEFEDEVYCPECFDRETVVCSRCGERIHIDDNSGTDEFPLCQECYDNHYTSCSHCGRLLLEDDAFYDDDEPYCSHCYNNCCRHGGVEDYYYKPEPIFYGFGSRFFGVELEVDGAGENDDSADEIMELANYRANHIYCKHDSSLDDGFEIVTHPMTLEYHQHSMPWERILDELRDMGYLSHQANTCGLHVHVNRDSFGATVEEQDVRIARVLYFFEKHWDELLKFSRRTNRQLERWAARYGYKDHPRDVLEHAKKGTPNGRYYCINLQNQATIEFRMFRGTLKYNTLIATLQLVNRVCEVAVSMSDDEVRSMSWTTFVKGCTQPELIRYLKERQLYVNEPVEMEEEV